MNLGNLYTDPKTFVDKPTRKPSQEVLNDFRNVTNNATSNDLDDVKVGSILDFMEEDFGGEGLELQALALDNFDPEPSFLGGVKDPIVQAFAKTVHGYWTQLIRGTNSSTLCDGVECESSLIPLNHTFVVPGAPPILLWFGIDANVWYRWPLPRAVLLGQLLDRGGLVGVRAIRHRQRHTAQLHGPAGPFKMASSMARVSGAV